MLKLEQSGIEIQLSPRKKLKVNFVWNNAGCESGEVAKKLGILRPTIKRKLSWNKWTRSDGDEYNSLRFLTKKCLYYLSKSFFGMQGISSPAQAKF